MNYFAGHVSSYEWHEGFFPIVLEATGFSMVEFRQAFPDLVESFGPAVSFNPQNYAVEGVEHLGRSMVQSGHILAFAVGENLDRAFRLDSRTFGLVGTGCHHPIGFFPAIFVRCDAIKIEVLPSGTFDQEIGGDIQSVSGAVEEENIHIDPRQKRRDSDATLVSEGVRLFNEGVCGAANSAAVLLVKKYGWAVDLMDEKNRGEIKAASYDAARDRLQRKISNKLNNK